MKARAHLLGMAAKIVVVLAAAGAGVFTWQEFGSRKTISNLLKENEKLQSALANLTDESQICYAKVLEQEVREGKLYTRLLFVETHPQDMSKRVLEKEYEIQGDVVHFDALIVKFADHLVIDGRERAMYLWRRIYGEAMAPQEGMAIEEPGEEPRRYQHICDKLSFQDCRLFWDEIWSLSNDPDRLAALGVRAIFGNVTYRKLRPGLIYVFKINNTGSLYSETIPDL